MEDFQEVKEKKNTLSHMKRHWLTIAFLLGFVVDNITLNRVDQFFDNFLLAMYVILAMVSLAVLYASAAGKIEGKFGSYAKRFAPMLVQYAFGGLLSGMLIFYGRSGSWTESWPYLAIILLAIFGNETIKDRATRLIYNLAILFVGLLSYIVLVIPVFTGLMGPWVFVGSGLIALFIMFWFIRILAFIVPRFIALHQKSIVFIIGLIFAGLNFLYFANIIPPIPLSLKTLGIYHSVVRFENGDYQLKYEPGEWYQPFKKSDDVFHPQQSDNIFCFAKVFAPTKIKTEIYHRWEYYDPTTKKWIEHARMSYAIAGGRDSGFRGYTFIQGYRDGQWRCTVETARGQVLGHEVFTVDSTNQAIELITRTE